MFLVLFVCSSVNAFVSALSLNRLIFDLYLFARVWIMTTAHRGLKSSHRSRQAPPPPKKTKSKNGDISTTVEMTNWHEISRDDAY